MNKIITPEVMTEESEEILKKKRKAEEALNNAKEQHFSILRKNNAVTDAKNGDLSALAMKLQDIILHEYQNTKQRKIKLELSYLRKRLKLQNSNNYVSRIQLALSELKMPVLLRDFKSKDEKREVNWALSSFLGDIVSYKDTCYVVEMEIPELFLEYVVEKAGYTDINLEVSVIFKTKYGYKMYELYLRYRNLPNRIDKNMGIIKLSMEALNEKFGTKHQYPAKMMLALERGLNDLEQITGVFMNCIYDPVEKKFVFAWEREPNDKSSKCIVPYDRVDEVINWIIMYSKAKITDKEHYSRKLRDLIFKGEFEGIEENYRGLLYNRYGMSSEEMDALKTTSGKYKDFDKEPVLF